MKSRFLPLVILGLFFAAHVIVPLVWGDLYPFTSAPMFRDSPTQYCNYHVFAESGTELPQEDWLLQRIYDGNPVGYGVGIEPPAVLEKEFGVVHDEPTVRQHFEQQWDKSPLQRRRNLAWVTVEQETFGPDGD